MALSPCTHLGCTVDRRQKDLPARHCRSMMIAHSAAALQESRFA
jgi:hypothetical protein